ncbi:hypothetical protein APHCRT_1165 [Anaplasma phagocytophilum str. CRT53-1]|uniref:Uncharacterized protein n=1 Tax=Anaplasma phagocytophilum str. CRT53-1 TaxID=1359157 RepID=A0A0F3PVK0_ANAPH|nr:hypothetical protein APHCRT_1165 [Anaplasma phagocytophilum str. CRT53-1]
MFLHLLYRSLLLGSNRCVAVLFYGSAIKVEIVMCGVAILLI